MKVQLTDSFELGRVALLSLGVLCCLMFKLTSRSSTWCQKFHKVFGPAMSNASKATGGKNRKVHGEDETSKMSLGDMENLANLLAKAFERKDERAIKLVDFVKQAAGLKEDAEIERDVAKSGTGGMSDAAKQRHDDWTAVEAFDVAGSALEMMQDFELVELELEEMEKNKPNLRW